MAQQGPSCEYKLEENAFVGPYKLVQYLDSGGMGQVWLAAPPNVDKKVVIKAILPSARNNPVVVNYFQAEGVIGARLHNNNLVNMVDRGPGYLVFEYVEGVTLYRLLDACKRLPTEWVVYIVSEVYKGLHYIHRARLDGQHAGIVHRDLTPGNIFILADGKVKIGDLGIAQLAGGLNIREQTHPGTGMVRGKLRYLSPEMAAGVPLDHRADIFQVGLVAYEALTGRQPFSGTRAGTDDIKNCNYHRIPQVVNDVPSAVVAAVEAQMAQDPGDRPQTAALARKLMESACPTFHRAVDESDPNGLIAAVLRLADLRASSTYIPNDELRALLRLPPPPLNAPEPVYRNLTVEAASEDPTILEAADPAARLDPVPLPISDLMTRPLRPRMPQPTRRAPDATIIDRDEGIVRKSRKHASPQGVPAILARTPKGPRGRRVILGLALLLIVAVATAAGLTTLRKWDAQDGRLGSEPPIAKASQLAPASPTLPQSVATPAQPTTTPDLPPPAVTTAPLPASRSVLSEAPSASGPATHAVAEKEPPSAPPGEDAEGVGTIVVHRERVPMRVTIDGVALVPPVRYPAEPGIHEIVIVRGAGADEELMRSTIRVHKGRRYTVNW